MAAQQTLSILKPDGVRRNLIGKILSRFESKGLRVAAMKMAHLSIKEAEGFYAVHRGRPFFDELTNMMSEAPVVLLVLEGENAIEKNREIMGATDPKKAAVDTIRKDFALNIGENTVHGSDSPENALKEIAYFFAKSEIVNTTL